MIKKCYYKAVLILFVQYDFVSNPLEVIYAWGDNPQCNLYNSAMLPASPFRTGLLTVKPDKY
jgi:hypothetical protein